MPRLPLAELLSSRRGEAAALATAVCWSVTPFFFTAASRRIGAFSANVIRLVIACVLLGAAVAATRDGGFPTTAQTLLFALSGFIGLALGDAALFEAFVLIGPRRVSLLGAVAPVIATLAAVPLLGHAITLHALTGMALTLGGVAWVVAERPADGEVPPGAMARGVTMGVLAAAGQALGAIFASAALGNVGTDSWLGSLAAGDGGPRPVSPLVGTFVRMLVGCGGIIAWAALRGRIGEVGRATSDRRALALTSCGAVFGPFVGVWLSLVAFRHTQTGVAQTIIAFSPVIVIGIARVVHGERMSARAFLGTLVAVGGVAVLVLRAHAD